MSIRGERKSRRKESKIDREPERLVGRRKGLRRSERENQRNKRKRIGRRQRGKKKNRREEGRKDKERSLESWCSSVLSTATRALWGRIRETGPLEISQARSLRTKHMKRSRRSSTPSAACKSIFVGHEHTPKRTPESEKERSKNTRKKKKKKKKKKKWRWRGEWKKSFLYYSSRIIRGCTDIHTYKYEEQLSGIDRE